MRCSCRFCLGEEGEETVLEWWNCLIRVQSWGDRSKVIYRATRQHALSLASFVALYKTLVLVQRKLNHGKEARSHTFLAGLLGGYIVFGDRNAVNEQVRRQSGLIAGLLMFCSR